jgi:phenylpropionate dioxygenase-like ring-hydroxylating dioxygenase large terminal subunit
MSTPPSNALPDVALTPSLQATLARLNDPLLDGDQAISLPIECYNSEEWFDFELRAIWDREWLCLGHHSTIPNAGDYLSLDLNGDRFLAVRGSDGAIRAISGVCQHRGHLLGERTGNVERFSCPYHGWAYDLEGVLISAPDMDVQALRSEHCLPQLRTEFWNGFIFINLDGRAPPLASRINGFTDVLKNYRLADLQALPPDDFADNPWNWKWMQENGLEPYHTPVAHFGTHDVAPAHQSSFPEWSDDDDGAVYYTTRFIHIDGHFTKSQKCIFPILPELNETDRWRVVFGVVPPNLLIATLPDSAFFFLTLPNGANKIDLRVSYLFPQSTLDLPDFEETYARLVEDINAINMEDITANVSVHQGRQSRFAKRGRVAPLEVPMAQINHWFVRRFRAYAEELERKVRLAARE